MDLKTFCGWKVLQELINNPWLIFFCWALSVKSFHALVWLCLSDPFSAKRNVARTVNSQQMYEYILHCLKTTFKYFALPLSMQAANQKKEAKRVPVQGANAKNLSEDNACLADLSRIRVQAKCKSQSKDEENGPEDSDCIIEEEEEVEEYSDSDEDGEREKEKVDLGKSSLSEDEEDEEEQDEDVDSDVQACVRQHFETLSFTTEDEEIFQVDEISGEELLSDEEGPDLDTPGSMDEEEEEEGEMAPVRTSPPPSESTLKDESSENKVQNQSRLLYEFTRKAFTRGKVCIAPHFISLFLQGLRGFVVT